MNLTNVFARFRIIYIHVNHRCTSILQKKNFHKLRIKDKKGKNYLKGKSQNSNHIFIYLCGKKWKLMGNSRKNADELETELNVAIKNCRRIINNCLIFIVLQNT